MKTILISIVVVFFLEGISCTQKERELGNQPPARSEQTSIKPVTPVSLSGETIDQFIAWAGRSDSTGYLKVREEILKAREDSTVLAPLFDRMEKTGTNDIGTSLIILGILGELKNPQLIGRLENFVWEPLPAEEKVGHGGLSKRDLVEMLESKAIECLAYVRTETSDKATLRVIREHASVAVRSAAIDAYLYNHEDSVEVKEWLRGIVQKQDLPFLDRVRRMSSGDREAFNEGLIRFYKLHPDMIAPAPGVAPGKAIADTGKVDKPIQPPPRR